MSDFFSGVNSGNIRMPDSQWNVGPLPSISGGPTGSNGDPDGVINGSGELLSGIVPYAYGESARTGSDRNYQQIPHRIQQIVHLLHLPHADLHQSDLVRVSHAVDQGDIAFLIQSRRIQNLIFTPEHNLDGKMSSLQIPGRNALCNICTVNYILAGLQRLDFSTTRHQQITLPWFRLAQDLDWNGDIASNKRKLLNFVRMTFIPFGICAGSEHQGGKHETGLAPVQAAVNHVTTLTIDGQNRDLVNLWRKNDISAGDQMIFRLEYLPTRSFTLNHYYKGVVHQSFSQVKSCWQLVPDLFRMTYNPAYFEGQQALDRPCDYDYRIDGYWRIGQCFQHRNKEKTSLENYSNDMLFLRGQLLQITFAPVWIQMDEPSATIVEKKIAETKTSSGSLPAKRKMASVSMTAFPMQESVGIGSVLSDVKEISMSAPATEPKTSSFIGTTAAPMAPLQSTNFLSDLFPSLDSKTTTKENQSAKENQSVDAKSDNKTIKSTNAQATVSSQQDSTKEEMTTGMDLHFEEPVKHKRVVKKVKTNE